MKALHLLPLLALLANCDSPAGDSETSSSGTQEIILPESGKPDAPPATYVFGVYCGECSGECATMWKYTTSGKEKTLWADHTDSFWRGSDKIAFGTQEASREKLLLAEQVVKEIPLSLLRSQELEQTFGCPDCTDGCGIFLQISTGEVTRTFHIDYQTEHLSPELAQFVNAIKPTLAKLDGY